ncbi:pesticidal protein Cry15Aa [Chloroflexia bacterium SDU3-3]|nr:pesticidal protein Cry15Aa [Chloroflexia bacterium SDU3-3]
MHTIKKYANRKLYHTALKQYITLDGISTLVRRGEPVEIIDNETGQNITAQILAQVALGGPSPLPIAVLTSLIQAGNDTLSGLRRTLASAIGGGDEVDEEIARRLDALVHSGAIAPDEHERMLALLAPHRAPAASPPSMLPSASDIERLREQIDALAALVGQLQAERGRRQPPEV